MRKKHTETNCQFHQRSMYSFYAHRSWMRKKTVKLAVSFGAFGTYGRKSCTQNVDEIDPRCVNSGLDFAKMIIFWSLLTTFKVSYILEQVLYHRFRIKMKVWNKFCSRSDLYFWKRSDMRIFRSLLTTFEVSFIFRAVFCLSSLSKLSKCWLLYLPECIFVFL